MRRSQPPNFGTAFNSLRDPFRTYACGAGHSQTQWQLHRKWQHPTSRQARRHPFPVSCQQVAAGWKKQVTAGPGSIATKLCHQCGAARLRTEPSAQELSVSAAKGSLSLSPFRPIWFCDASLVDTVYCLPIAAGTGCRSAYLWQAWQHTVVAVVFSSTCRKNHLHLGTKRYTRNVLRGRGRALPNGHWFLLVVGFLGCLY